MTSPTRSTAPLALAAALALVRPSAAAERPWIEARSPEFTVITNAGEREARAIVREFEQIRAVFQTLTPRAPQTSGRPFTALAARDEATMKRLLPWFWEQKRSVRPAGIFISDALQTFVVVRGDLERGDEVDHSVVFHEYVHFLADLHYDALPLWLSEGLADFYATSTIERDRVLVGRAAPWSLQLLKEKRLLPLDALFTLEADSPLYREKDRATIFYAQSWALVHYFLNDEKGVHRPRLAAYVERLRQGIDPLEAARQAFGDLKALSRALDAYVNGFRFFMQPVPTAAAPAERDYVLRPLGPGETLARIGTFHASVGRTEEALAALEEATRLDPQLSLGWVGLTLVRGQQQRLPEAGQAARDAVRTDPQSLLARYVLAMVSLARRDAAAAETELTRAIEINDRFAPAHALLARAKAALGRPGSEVVAAARRAVQLEPGNAAYQLALATALRDGGDFDGARHAGERARRLSRTSEQRALVEAALSALERKVPSDPAAAAQHHLAACDAGGAASCLDLGLRVERGDGVAKDYARAVTLYTRACEAGHGKGCENLGRMYHHGRGVSGDLSRSRSLYEKACSGQAVSACDSLAEMLAEGDGGDVDLPRSVTLFATGCDAGRSYACMYLGWLHEEGKGVAANPQRAAELFTKACETGNPEGCRRLGFLYSDGNGVAQDPARASAFHERACNGGDMAGCGWLGVRLRRGEGVAKDAARAAGYLERACDAGHARFCTDLARLLETGDGVSKDATRAVALYRKACDGDDKYGCGVLGRSLLWGLGIDRDPARGVELLTLACAGDELSYCNDLAHSYELGLGVRKDRAKAVATYRSACRPGNQRACVALAWLIREEKPAEAKTLLQTACDTPDLSGCEHLALLYVFGLGVPQDFARAHRMLGAGCEAGHGASCSTLAGLHLGGHGVPADAAKANTLKRKACSLGHRPACPD